MGFDTQQYTQGVWLKGEDLDEGERTVVTIKTAEEHTFQDGKKQPVLEFLELGQKLSLNKTRIKKLVEMLDDDPDEWVGKRIALYPVPTQYNGQTYSSVAVAMPPKGKQGKIKPEVKFMAEDEDEDDNTPF